MLCCESHLSCIVWSCLHFLFRVYGQAFINLFYSSPPLFPFPWKKRFVGRNVRAISVSVPFFPCVNALPSKNTASLFIYCVRRDLGLRWPRFTSDPRVKSVLGKLKTGVGVVLAAPTQSNCGHAADCLRPEKGLLHFTVTGSLESLLKFKRTISNWLEHIGKESLLKIKGKEYCHGTMPEPLSPVSSDTHTF